MANAVTTPQEDQRLSIPSITFMNWSGDVTISWTPEREEEIVTLVEKMMKDHGYRFFIIKPRFLCFGSKQVPLTNVQQLRGSKGLVAPDETATALINASGAAGKGISDDAVRDTINAGAASTVRPASGNNNSTAVRLATSAREVIQHQTMAVRVVTGG